MKKKQINKCFCCYTDFTKFSRKNLPEFGFKKSKHIKFFALKVRKPI